MWFFVVYQVSDGEGFLDKSEFFIFLRKEQHKKHWTHRAWSNTEF